MTVCIAARAQSVIIGTSDRMLTSGDVQFEPSAATKIVPLTNSIFVMTAGDAGLQTEILRFISGEITARIHREPTNWWLVRDVADLYIQYYNTVRNKRAADAILRPLYLDGPSFIANQGGMNDRLVNDISKELLNFTMPHMSAIFAGLDPTGAHIYLVNMGDTYALESTCMDSVGFAAIGSGARHASSQFMFARHAWNAPTAETLFLSYYAKRKAEVAPGVGQGTDMIVVGPAVGTLALVEKPAMAKLETEYQKVKKAEERGFAKAKEGMNRYVEELQRQAQQAAPQEQPPPPKTNGGTPSADGSKV